MAVLNSDLGICFIEVKREAAVYKFQWMNTNYSEWKLQMQHQQIVLMSGKKKKVCISCVVLKKRYILQLSCVRGKLMFCLTESYCTTEMKPWNDIDTIWRLELDAKWYSCINVKNLYVHELPIFLSCHTLNLMLPTDTRTLSYP